MHDPTASPLPSLPAALDRLGLDWFLDSFGNYGVVLPGASVRFHRVDLDGVETLQARAAWGRRASLDHLEKLHAVLATLNFERPFPKAYARVLDDGAVAVVWESLLAGLPATAAEVETFVGAFVSRTVSQLRKLDALLPDPLGGVPVTDGALLADPAADSSAPALAPAPLPALVDDAAARPGEDGGRPEARAVEGADAAFQAGGEAGLDARAGADAVDLPALADLLRAQGLGVTEYPGALEVAVGQVSVRVEAHPEVARVCTALDASDWLEVAPAVVNDWNQHMLAPAAGMDALGGGSEVSVELVFDAASGVTDCAARLAWALHAVARGATALEHYGLESAGA